MIRRIKDGDFFSIPDRYGRFCRLQAEWAPLWETSGYHLSGCGADCSTTLGIKPVRRLDSRPLRDCRADQGRIHSLSGPGPMFR